MEPVIKSPFCPNGTAHLKIVPETVDFRGRQYRILAHYYVCDQTKIEFTDKDTDEKNLEQVYGPYRKEMGLPEPMDLMFWRSDHKLTVKQMAEKVGVSEDRYQMFERGAIPEEEVCLRIKQVLGY